MNDKLSHEQNEQIVNALNKAIADGPWEESNFLKILGKNLVELRDKFVEELGIALQEPAKIQSQLIRRSASTDAQQEVYVSLYSSDGINLQSWERIIANLPRQMISRPIYANEDALKEIIKTKENKLNEAYVAIYINQSDILTLPPDKSPVDKLGTVLLCLKDKTLNLESITKVVHVSGIYHYLNGRLIKNS